MHERICRLRCHVFLKGIEMAFTHTDVDGDTVRIKRFFNYYSPYLPWKQFKQYACSPTVSSLIHSVHMVVVDSLILLTNDT